MSAIAELAGYCTRPSAIEKVAAAGLQQCLQRGAECSFHSIDAAMMPNGRDNALFARAALDAALACDQ